MQKTMILWF